MVLIWILLALFILFLLLTGLAWMILQSVFGKRCESNPNLTYFTADDFDGLTAKPVEFPSNKGQILRGNLYSHPDAAPYKALLIFVHGMGGGHLSYTTEINTLAKNGFLVLSYDQTGTCSSDGKKLGGFTQGVLDLRAALRYAEANPDLSGYPVVLAGHSWGGYIVCQVLQFSPKVKAVAAMSAFEEEATLICSFAGSRTGIPFGFLKPFFRLIQRIKFGNAANRKTSDILRAANVPVLLLHGSRDTMVGFRYSAAARFSGKGETRLIKSVIYPEKYHNVYQSAESEQYLNQTFAEIAAKEKQYRGKLPPEEIKALYGGIDYTKMTEEDPEVMKLVSDFLTEAL